MKHSAHLLSPDNTILIVDDTPENLRFLAKVLETQGYTVRKALDGQMALASCRKSLPNLILLDVMMPGLNGYQVCETLKSNPESSTVPVIFLSALADSLDKVKAFEAGGADYITKPFQIEEVLARVRHQLMLQQMQKTLSEQNSKLQALNKELELFAYIASHDLKSPLQTIIGYVQALNWSQSQALNTEGKQYLEKIDQSAWRMKHLIDDLLNHSRIETQPPLLEKIESESVVAEVLEFLQTEVTVSKAQISYSDLPMVNGDRTQLIQLFQNLVTNAIKFQAPDATPQVTISATAKGIEAWLFQIQDNGIGIASEHFQQIFEPFQRLHTHHQYPGTGLGMSICKKIVERHGGTIWLESQLGTGTTFYFTLPCVSEPV